MLKNIKYLERFPYDDFFFEMLNDALPQFDSIGKSYSVHYNNEQLSMINTSDDFVVIATTDCLYLDRVNELARRLPDTKFLVLSLNLTKEFVEHSNLQIVNWGPCLRQQKDYELVVTPTKKFTKPWHWHFISGYTRHHRMMLALVLAGFDLERFGYMQVNPFPIHHYKNWQKFYKLEQKIGFPFDTYNEQSLFLEYAFSKWKTGNITLHESLPSKFPYNGNNAENFDKYLRQYYEQSAIEVLCETEYYSIGYHTSEKFLHSVMGLTIPLFVGQRYHVKYLRELGFDMFEDIIDVSYDEIEDPLLRMYTAIKDNLKVLTDKSYCLELYGKCDSRLRKNRDLAVYNLFNIVKQNTNEEIRRASYWLSE